MEKYKIYQDDKITIEIFKPLHDYLESLKIEWLNLVPTAKEIVYEQVFKDLRKRHIRPKEKLTSANIPIIEKDRPITLSPPFDVFNQICYLLSSADFDEIDKEIIEQEIESFSVEDDYQFFCKIFPDPLFKIHGYIAYYKNESLIILLFSIGRNHFED